MSPTEARSSVSHRKLGIFGVVALISAGLVVGTGIRAREDQGSKLKEWTDDQAVPSVAVALPNAKARNATIDLPGRLEAYSVRRSLPASPVISKAGAPTLAPESRPGR